MTLFQPIRMNPPLRIRIEATPIPFPPLCGFGEPGVVDGFNLYVAVFAGADILQMTHTPVVVRTNRLADPMLPVLQGVLLSRHKQRVVSTARNINSLGIKKRTPRKAGGSWVCHPGLLTSRRSAEHYLSGG